MDRGFNGWKLEDRYLMIGWIWKEVVEGEEYWKSEKRKRRVFVIASEGIYRMNFRIRTCIGLGLWGGFKYVE